MSEDTPCKLKPYLEQLTKDHIGLANSVAYAVYKQATHALELDELRSEAYRGLVSAASRWEAYCAERGYSTEATQYYTAFAHRYARGAVYDYIRAKDWATRSLRDKSKKLRLAGSQEDVSSEELSERTGMSVKEVNEVLSAMANHPPVSLESLTESVQRTSPTAVFEVADSEDVESTFSLNRILNAWVDKLESLPEECQYVIALHYYWDMDFKAISQLIGVPETRNGKNHIDTCLILHETLRETASDISLSDD